MNNTFPCVDCVVRPGCSKFCDDLLKYYSKIIKSYGKYGDRSRLMKAASKNFPKNMEVIKKGIRTYNNILVTNPLSRKSHTINRRGKIMKGKRGDNIF